MLPCAADGLFLVRSTSGPVERDLPQAFAAYLVALRTVSDIVLRQRLTKKRRAALLADLQDKMQAVNADWVFVAKVPGATHFYVHNCLTRLGTGALSPQDALFIDAAKQALPRLLQDPELRPTPRKVFLPRRRSGRRMTAAEVAQEYAGFAASDQTFHHLSGRYEVAERTTATIEPIVANLPLAKTDRVLDIGCGDATFLRRIAPSIAHGAGTVVSAAELRRLQNAPDLAHLTFYQASFDDLSSIPETFDAIVANGCFHFVMDTPGAHRALAAILGLLRPGGRIWIGELHTRDHRVPRTFATKPQAIAYAARLHGPRFALGYALHLWRRRHRATMVVDRAPRDGCWTCTPANLARIAAAYGLRVERAWDCFELTGDTFYRVEDRRSYLLTRV